MTRSAASPFLTRSRSEPAVLKMRSSVLPLARSNSRPSASTIDCTAPALRTLMVGIGFPFLSAVELPGLTWLTAHDRFVRATITSVVHAAIRFLPGSACMYIGTRHRPILRGPGSTIVTPLAAIDKGPRRARTPGSKAHSDSSRRVNMLAATSNALARQRFAAMQPGNGSARRSRPLGALDCVDGDRAALVRSSREPQGVCGRLRKCSHAVPAFTVRSFSRIATSLRMWLQHPSALRLEEAFPRQLRGCSAAA